MLITLCSNGVICHVHQPAQFAVTAECDERQVAGAVKGEQPSLFAALLGIVAGGVFHILGQAFKVGFVLNVQGVGIGVLYAVFLELYRKCGKTLGQFSVLVAVVSGKVGTVAYKTVVCLFEQALLLGGEVAVVAFIDALYTREKLLGECYVVLVCNVQLLHLLFNGKYLVIAAGVGNGIECADDIAKQQSCVVQCCNGVLECCGIAVVAYVIDCRFFACNGFLYCRDVMPECDAVIWNCAIRCFIWHQ